MTDFHIAQFSLQRIFPGQILRRPPHVFVQESITFPELAIQNEVDVRVHKHECQNQDLVFQRSGIHPVHAVLEIVSVKEHRINRFSCGIEMPAVIDGNSLSFDIWPVEAKVGRDFCPEFVTVQHSHFNRLWWQLP